MGQKTHGSANSTCSPHATENAQLQEERGEQFVVLRMGLASLAYFQLPLPTFGRALPHQAQPYFDSATRIRQARRTTSEVEANGQAAKPITKPTHHKTNHKLQMHPGHNCRHAERDPNGTTLQLGDFAHSIQL